MNQKDRTGAIILPADQAVPARRRARLSAAAAAALACSLWGGLPSASRAQPAPPPRAAAGPAPAAPVAPAPPQSGQPAAGNEVGQKALDEARVALAERFVSAAEDVLHRGIPGEHQWQQAAALLKAASTLNPAEPSYPRLLAEAWRQLGDNGQVIASLNDFRRASREAHWPEDQVVQAELIDRYLAEMQTDDKRLAYLRGVVAMNTLAPEVQAHAAVLAVPILAQRSGIEAGQMLQQAIRLDPVNLRARRMQYETVAVNGSPLERVQVLLWMIRCNPAQRDVMIELARQLADAGLADLSLEWYRGALILSERIGAPFDNPLVLEFVTQLYVAGQTAEAGFLLDKVLGADPRNPTAWFMRLAFDRSDPTRASDYQQEVDVARRVFQAQMLAVSKKVMGQPALTGLGGGAAETPPGAEGGAAPAGPATGSAASGAGPRRPAPPAVPDSTETAGREATAAVIDRIKKGAAPDNTGDLFISAASDLAWYHLYFEGAPDEAVRWVDALKALLPADDPRVLRLQGWLDLSTNRVAQARAELTAAQDIDPMAAMGVIRMTARGMLAQAATRPAAPAPGSPAAGPATRAATRGVVAAAPEAPAATAPATAPPGADQEKNFQQADAVARQLMGRNPVGLAGAVVWAAYRDRKLHPDARADAAALRDELAGFNKTHADWVRIIDKADQFYFVVGKPVQMRRALGEPLFAWVTILNKSGYPLTVGPDGVLSPDLFFDARVGIQGDQTFPMAAYDRIANVLVVPPHSQTTQVVRIDQGAIAAELRKNPTRDVAIYVRVTTNPIARGADLVPGPAGMRRDFNQQFVRHSAAMLNNVQKQQVLAGLRGRPADMMRTLESLTATIRAAREVPPARAEEFRQLLALPPELTGEIEKVRKDPIPDVAAWATFQEALVAAPADRPALAESLRASAQWEVRLLGGVAALDLSDEQARPLADLLSHDTQAECAAFGAALLEDLSHPTRRPAVTRPSPAGPAPAAPAPDGTRAPAPAPATRPATRPAF